ncbi:acetolactate synthase I/II/III large subunit [Rhodococcoides trifolii]|uniref:acetolactate synthase n=1 Tax=Rhodococcoides trifolii TaxID=908250 RepID=A0A917G327_9NOCA|nr:acetolactate synthase large subunit [Rhodococcus trifolii]GGG20232.1 acetolactate synthase I/II/III large subunit [Rhodococcus trifolii]
MIGSQALIRTLVDAQVSVCFMNPGTSEMHFVHSLDSVPEMRGVLTLFEGVATGAADGYARIADKPAAVLLHLGPGLGNGLANMHNARRAHSPIVAVVGAHATFHEKYDAPLQSDIESVARTVSGWVHTSGLPRDVAEDGAEAVAAAMTAPKQIATLVLPADVSWSEGAEPVAPHPAQLAPAVPSIKVSSISRSLASQQNTVILLGGPALGERGLRAASRIAAATGVHLLAECFPARLERGAGVPNVDRVAYLAEAAQEQFDGVTRILLAGAVSPVSFFAYPGKVGDLVPEGCVVETLAGLDQDIVGALEAVARDVAAEAEPVLSAAVDTPRPTGELNVMTLAAAIAHTLPDNAIVVDEANTSGFALPAATAGAPRHSLLTLTGGAIGQGMPVAVGAAIAAPDRRVVNLESDGSALYTIQALWTQARENLDVTTILINNSSYAILRMELLRVGADNPGPRALEMLDLSKPDVDFTAIATGLGVSAVRVTTVDELVDAIERANSTPGPSLIEAIVPPIA